MQQIISYVSNAITKGLVDTDVEETRSGVGGWGDETDRSVDERRRLSGSLLLFVWLCPRTALKTARQYTSQFFYDLEGIRGNLRSTMVSLNMWEHVRNSELTSVEISHHWA